MYVEGAETKTSADQIDSNFPLAVHILPTLIKIVVSNALLPVFYMGQGAEMRGVPPFVS